MKEIGKGRQPAGMECEKERGEGGSVCRDSKWEGQTRMLVRGAEGRL